MTDAGPRLLVPIAVEALVAGANAGQTTWANITPNFGLMEFGLTLGADLEPAPFATSPTMPRGVHLRWALPDGLTHGVQGQAVAVAELENRAVKAIRLLNGGFGYVPAAPPLVTMSGGGGAGATARAVVDSTGVVTSIQVVTGGAAYDAPPTVAIGSSDAIRYPKIPNRWFVLRSHADDQARRVTLASWVVVSDVLSQNEYGRIVQGTLPSTYRDQLRAGRISPMLRQALNDQLGLSIVPEAVLATAPNAPNVWTLNNITSYYSIEVLAQDLLVLGQAAVSWPTISQPDPYAVFPPYEYLGRAWPYGLWDGANPPEAETNLTAIGPGDPSFAASYPNSRSVLGFYDDLKDLPNGGRVTYTVAGWYADPADNPLAGAVTTEQWVERMDELRWCIEQDPGGYPPAALCDTTPGGAAGAALPQDVLCQGMVYDIDWKGPNANYASGVPTKRPDIALGNTSVEAISALVAAKLAEDGVTSLPDGVGIEELLEAFLYDVLDVLTQPDGLIRLEQVFHEKTFAQLPGETVWGVMQRQTESAEIREDQTAGAPFPPDVSEMLSRVNTLQAASTQKLAELRSLQWEMYSAWFRKAMLDQAPLADVAEVQRASFSGFEHPPVDIPREEIEARLRAAAPAAAAAGVAITPAQITVVIQRIGVEINQRKLELATIDADLKTDVAALIELVAREMPGYEVTQSAGQSYWRCDDPVVMFAGDGVERTFAHGEDTALADGERLPCRVSGQTISALTTPVPGHADQTITQAQLRAWYGSFPSGAPIPGDIEPLFIETLLLDTTMAVLMAVSAWQLAGVANPDAQQIAEVAAEIRKIQTAPLNAFLPAARRTLALDAQQIAEGAGLTGVYPYKLAVDPWAQPWAPIYLEWDVFWTASYALPRELAICDTTATTCVEKWMFDEVDYQWNPKFPPVSGSDPRYRYTGRTMIAPNVPDNLARRLLEYLDEHPDSPYAKELRAAYEIIRNLEVLSQSVGGFSDSLAMRRQTLQLPVIDYFNPALGRQVAAAIGDQNQVSPMPNNGYTPLRGGHARIVRLWVVDAFGQAQRIIDEGAGFTPILSKPLITAGNPALIQLTPRAVQPNRLGFRWIDGDDDARVSTSDPATAPIAGWIVPNYFDNSIMVYDARGLPVGALQLLAGALGAGGTGVRWLEPPGTVTAVGAQPSLDNPHLNPHLRGFVNGLLSAGGEGRDALSDLIVVLNATLSTIVVTGSAANYGNLPVLIGRPLALLRAAVKIELEGLPAYDQSWAALEEYYRNSRFVTGGFTDVRFPVRIGDVRQSRDGVIGYFVDKDYRTFCSKLLEHSTRSNYIRFDQRLHLTADPAGARQYVTLVVDPRAPIHIVADFAPEIVSTLPQIGTSTALSAMDLTFRVGPLLSDESLVSLPLPADIHGRWSWLYHPDVTVWSTAEQIQNEDGLARFTQLPRHVNEGWLKLSDAFREDTKSTEPPK